MITAIYLVVGVTGVIAALISFSMIEAWRWSWKFAQTVQVTPGDLQEKYKRLIAECKRKEKQYLLSTVVCGVIGIGSLVLFLFSTPQV